MARDDRLDSRSGLTATTLRRSIEAAGLPAASAFLGRARSCCHPPFPTFKMGALRTMWRARRHYNRWPPYTYVADTKPGQARGHAIKLDRGYWYVLAPSGKVVTKKP